MLSLYKHRKKRCETYAALVRDGGAGFRLKQCRLAFEKRLGVAVLCLELLQYRLVHTSLAQLRAQRRHILPQRLALCCCHSQLRKANPLQEDPQMSNAVCQEGKALTSSCSARARLSASLTWAPASSEASRAVASAS